MAASESPGAEAVRVEVAFAMPYRQRIVELTLPAGTTAREAVAQAGLDAHFPELPPETFAEAELGLFGKALRDPAAQALRDGDRVEVYRPLRLDPKAARAARAARAKRSS